MEIVDAQLHRPLPQVPWPEFDGYSGYAPPGGGTIEQRPSGEIQLAVGVELLAASLEAVGVDAAIVYSDLAFCEAAIARHPEKFAAVLDYYEPSELGDPEEFLADLRSRPGVLGIRIQPGIEFAKGKQLRTLTEGGWDPTLEAAERLGVPIVFYMPFELPALTPVAQRFPGLSIIVDHCGMSSPPVGPKVDDNLATLPELLALAAYPNVGVKLTGWPILKRDSYPFAALWPALHQLVERFGPERLMWGSDIQRVSGRAWQPPLPIEGFERINYAECVDFLRYTSEIGEAEKSRMLGESTREWFGWPAGSPSSKMVTGRS